MSELVTTGGLKIYFDSTNVSAISDRSEAGMPVTCVFGIAKSPVQISEGVQPFLVRLSLVQKFAKLTCPNGAQVWIDGSAVGSLRAAVPGEYDESVRSVLSVGDMAQGVCEDVSTVVASINAHGGKL